MMPIARPLAALALVAACLPALAAPRALVPEKSRIEFAVTQMGVEVTGQFRRFDAQIALDAADPATASAQVTVDIASLSTGDADADAVALDQPWLNLADFAQASFVSRSVRMTGKDRYEASGTLSIRGQTREISVPFTLAEQADGSAIVSGRFTVHRADFGIGGGEWNEGDLVANEVPVRFTLHLAAP